MANNELISRLEDKNKVRSSDGRKRRQYPRFLSLSSAISEAIEKKYSLKDIWRVLSEDNKLDVSYETFLRYWKTYSGTANKTSRKITHDAREIRDSLSESVESLNSDNSDQKSISLSKRNTFDFDPKPKKDDLV